MWRRWRITSTLLLPSTTGWTGDLKVITVYKKGLSRLYFLRKLRSFNVCSKMLEIFYQSVLASVLFFAVVCWGSSSDTKRLNKLIRKAGSVIGWKQDILEAVMERRTLKNCYPSWIILSTLSSSHWSDSGGPFPKGCSSFAFITTDTGNLSCHKPSLYIITLSPLPDKENSDLSTVLSYILLLFIVYFALYIYFADPLLLSQNNFPVWDQ